MAAPVLDVFFLNDALDVLQWCFSERQNDPLFHIYFFSKFIFTFLCTNCLIKSHKIHISVLNNFLNRFSS